MESISEALKIDSKTEGGITILILTDNRIMDLSKISFLNGDSFANFKTIDYSDIGKSADHKM